MRNDILGYGSRCFEVFMRYEVENGFIAKVADACYDRQREICTTFGESLTVEGLEVGSGAATANDNYKLKVES